MGLENKFPNPSLHLKKARHYRTRVNSVNFCQSDPNYPSKIEKTWKQIFSEIRESSQYNEDILGFVVTGSRGKGFENAWSDYDFAIFVSDTALEKFEEKYKDLPPGGRLYIFTLDSFKTRATWKSNRHWERYTWAHLTVENDRSGGEIKKLLDEKSKVPENIAEDHMRQSLRWYFNQVYHSLKNLRAGNMIGYHMEAAEGIRPFLEAIFCLHNRRLVPYYKYLRWELETYPLNKLNLSADELLQDITRILDNGDYRTQQKLLRETHRIFTVEGYGEYFEWSMPIFALNFQLEIAKQ